MSSNDSALLFYLKSASVHTCSQSQQVVAPLPQGSLRWHLIGQAHCNKKEMHLNLTQDTEYIWEPNSIMLDVSDIPLTSTHPLPCPSYEIRYLHVSLLLSGCWNKNLHLALICHSRAPLRHYEWIRITHDRSLPLCLSNSRLPRESKPSLPTPPLPRPPRPPLGPPRPRNGLSPTALM